MDYPYACWRKNSTDVLIMSLLNKMIYYNTAVFCLRYESHANIGVALAPKKASRSFLMSRLRKCVANRPIVIKLSVFIANTQTLNFGYLLEPYEWNKHEC